MTTRTAPRVLGLLIEPGDEVAVLRALPVNERDGLSALVQGDLEVVDLDGGSVLWLDGSGKVKGLATNLLATKIAHRLNAGLYPDDTINGRAVVVGEAPGPDGELRSVDLTAATLDALRAVGVTVHAQASQEVLLVAGGSYLGSLNHENAGGGCMVTTQQVDEWLYVVGQDDFTIVRQSIADWLGEDPSEDVTEIPAADARDAWTLLQSLRADCLVWQCGACDAWLFTSDRPRIGVLRCGTCGDGGVDFRHADRHLGAGDES